MLQDLYLLSCYFDASQARLYSDLLERRYGAETLRKALRDGLIELYTPFWPDGGAGPLCRLSPKGRDLAQRTYV